MYRGAKYVIMLIEGEEIPFIFSGIFKHSDLRVRGVLTSAGFVSIYENNGEIFIECRGKSETLGIASDPKHDAELIRKEILNGTVYG